MGARAIRHESEQGRWEMVRTAPHPSLRAHVREYVGWFEHFAVPICRREVPTDEVPVIINFGAPIRLYDVQDPSRWTDYGSFTTGAFDSYVLVGSTGPSGGLQINLSILGARLFLGQPLKDLRNRAIALEDVFGRDARLLTMELFDAPSWDARFTILDRELALRIRLARAPAPAAVWIWRRLVETGGRVSIGTLVDELGFSQRHLIAQFRQEIGLSPKTLARVLRFGRAIRIIKGGGTLRLAEIAQDCGYYDQAHFSRDFHAFAGVTPTELVRSQLPDGGGFTVDRSDSSKTVGADASRL
jgi:AraC-like DNA-binding protein